MGFSLPVALPKCKNVKMDRRLMMVIMTVGMETQDLACSGRSIVVL
jgi:hypothetical protein